MGGEGVVVATAVPSALLGEDIHALVLTPPPAFGGAVRWLYLLHGRGAEMEHMRPLLLALEEAMAARRLPRHVVVAPDGPWSQRASWWVDSEFAPADRSARAPGRPVESAVLCDLVPALERRWGAPSSRDHRVIGGISMGGAAALRWVLVHPGLFGSAVLLSPAVHAGRPPRSSSALSSTAFGRGGVPYDLERFYELLHYRTLLAARGADAPALRVAIVAGEAEPVHDGGPGEDEWLDLDLESARLHAALKRQATITSSLRIVGGGHDRELWSREVADGLRRAGGASG